MVIGTSKKRTSIAFLLALMALPTISGFELDDVTCGTQGYEPCVITTYEDLTNVEIHGRDKAYLLDNDINAPEGSNFDPIGYIPQHLFTGSFNGGGHTIRNLNIDHPSEHFQGLFGAVNNAEIYNLILENPAVSGRSYVGSLAGYVEYFSIIRDVIIKNPTVTGYETDYYGYVGGLAGFAWRTTFTCCHVHQGTVNGNDRVGGLVGWSYGIVDIEACSVHEVIVNGVEEKAVHAGGPYGGIAGESIHLNGASSNVEGDYLWTVGSDKCHFDNVNDLDPFLTCDDITDTLTVTACLTAAQECGPILQDCTDVEVLTVEEGIVVVLDDIEDQLEIVLDDYPFSGIESIFSKVEVIKKLLAKEPELSRIESMRDQLDAMSTIIDNKVRQGKISTDQQADLESAINEVRVLLDVLESQCCSRRNLRRTANLNK